MVLIFPLFLFIKDIMYTLRWIELIGFIIFFFEFDAFLNNYIILLTSLEIRFKKGGAT